jgi:bifunctional non-homologous end joining protein LigD
MAYSRRWMGLSEYNRKRNFAVTSEPPGEAPGPTSGERPRGFVIQKHAASRLHYDFRLELDGVLKSWSVPKGPSLFPTVKRLAVHVEDHPLAYADFEGIIPKGQYGGGAVLLWDRGTWKPLGDPHEGYSAGNLKFVLEGTKLHGAFALIKLRGRGAQRGVDQERAWLLIKEQDGDARDRRPADGVTDITEERPESVTTGRTLEEIAADRSRVWHSNTARPDSADLAGAPTAALPARIRPPRFVMRAAPPDGPAWLHELAISGERLLARSDHGQVQLLDERGAPLGAGAARERSAVADAIRMLPAQTLIVDGVLAAVTPDGHSDAAALPGALAGKSRATLVYFLFDLPHLDGHDLAGVALERRKALLATLIRRDAEPGPIRYLDHVGGSGAAFRREAQRLGIPAVVSRRADSRYGARAAWTRSSAAVSGGR